MGNQYVYAVVYSSAVKKCLVFQKKERGYYFGLKPDGTSATFLLGGKPLNGGGKCCFPGGGLKDKEDPLYGAVREFKEETGVHLDAYGKKLVSFEEQVYHAVFFDVDGAFDGIFNQCQKNIRAKESALGELDSYSTDNKLSFLRKKTVIEDDELASVEQVMLDELKTRPETVFPNNETTGWFHNIVQNFPVADHCRRPIHTEEKRKYVWI
jgi:8-oxo-dGTP pyrophosphatase MutT (NUDIX family)